MRNRLENAQLRLRHRAIRDDFDVHRTGSSAPPSPNTDLWETLKRQLDELDALAELAREDPNDEAELKSMIRQLARRFDDAERALLP